MRRAHVLSRNHGGEGPVRVLCVDTETREELQPNGERLHRLTFGWSQYRRRHTGQQWSEPQWYRFTTPTEFWDYVEPLACAGTRLCLYAHNVAFDAVVLDAFNLLESRGWTVTKACLEGPPTIIAWRKGRATIQWLDTLNYWRTSLKELGRHVGLAKLDMPAIGTVGPEADDYCRRDVEIVWKALKDWWDFLRDNDLGTVAPTLAAQSLAAYRHRFMSAEIFIDTNDDALELARASYMGGRNECFRLGYIGERVTTVDVNSMYPAVMRDLLCPTQLLTVTGHMAASRLEAYLVKYAAVAEVTLDTDTPIYPVYHDERLCFPVGRFTTTLTTPELALALERGHICSVHRVALYERAELFRDFVEWIWSQRQRCAAAGDDVGNYYFKILGNSLYGKFGQRGQIWVETSARLPGVTADLSSYDLDTKTWRRMRAVGGVVQLFRNDAESFNSHPAIAAHVTAAARVKLWRLMERAGLEWVVYIDTDGIKLLDPGFERLRDLVSPSELGGLKVEKVEAWLQVNGCKDYTGPGGTKLKGVRPDAFMLGEDIRLTEQWSNWRGLLERGDLSAPVVKPWVKGLSRVYTKGDVVDGGRVLPLRLGGHRGR